MATTPERPKDATRHHPRAEPRRARRAAVRRHAGLRGRPARLPRHAARGRDQERPGPRRLEPQGLRLPRRRAGAAHRQSEPLAPGATQHAPRPLPGDGPHLPDPRLRHLEHDDHRGRPRASSSSTRSISTEVARAGLDLYRAASRTAAGHRGHLHAQPHRPLRRRAGRRRRGATSSAGRVEIIAPDRFMQEVVSENVLAGTAMIRRAQFQFGATLPKGPRGQVDAGLGKVTSRGTVTLIPPTRIITAADRDPPRSTASRSCSSSHRRRRRRPRCTCSIPALRALNLAENATHNLHNIYPIRGAQVRDANAWARYLNEALDRFGRDADVVFAQHHWPVWGNRRVLDFLGQAARSLQVPARPDRAAHEPRLQGGRDRRAARPCRRASPATWHVRGYYGTLSHNAKAVYQRYLGWYDANPANLNPLPPVERGRKYVEYMGGAEAAIAPRARGLRAGRVPLRRRGHEPRRLRRSVERRRPPARRRRPGAARLRGGVGDLAQRVSPRRARAAAGPCPATVARAPISPDVVRAMSLDLFFDYLGVRLNGEKAEGRRIVINWVFSDLGPPLRAEPGELRPDLSGRPAGATRADATVTLDRAVLNRLVLRELTVADAVRARARRTSTAIRPRSPSCSACSTTSP